MCGVVYACALARVWYVCVHMCGEKVYCVHIYRTLLYSVLLIVFSQWLSPYGGYSFVCQYHVADSYVPVQ